MGLYRLGRSIRPGPWLPVPGFVVIRDRRLSQIPGLIQIGHPDGLHTVDDSLIELLIADRINPMDAMAHARDPNFVKEEFQKALKSQRKGWFAGIFNK